MGAWEWNYRQGMAVDTPRKVAGVHACKAALIANGYSSGIIPDWPGFGKYARLRTVDYQEAVGISADGIIGPTTMRHLLRVYVLPFEQAHHIPDSLLGRQGTLESGQDPVAIGVVDPDDRGWGQINSRFHPEVTDALAYDPAYAIPWAGGQLLGATHYCDGDIDGGLAAYNIGWPYARAWVRAGKPATGGPTLGSRDSFAIATQYVGLVRGSAH